MKKTVDVRTVALNRAIATLNSIGAQYKIICADGAEYGELEAKPRAKKRPEYPMGTIRNYFTPMIKDLKPGEVTEVPIGEYGFDRVQDNMCSYATTQWGAGSYYTTRDPDRQSIMIMRVM